MRDVFSNETLKEINDLIDEIIENLDDNVETVENPPAVSRENGIASIFTSTNYDGTQRVFSASDTTIQILLDGNENAGKSQRRSLKFTIGDKNGVAFEKNDDDTQYYIWWESDFGIDQQNDGCLRFRFDGDYGTDDTYPVKAYYTYEMTGLTAGKTYTITFTGGFGTTTPENFNLGGALIISELVGQTMTTIAQEDFASDAQTHSYSVTFTPTGTEVYLKFDFTNVIKTSDPHALVFAIDEFTYTGLDLGVTGAYVWFDGWHLISTGGGGGTSDLDAIELTYAEYQALTPAEKTDPDKIYFITDYPSGSGVVINPTGTATDTAETIEVDGTIYDFAGTDADAVHTADIGVAGGVAELDANGKVPSSQLPTYPTVGDGTITIQKNGTNVDTFSTNQSSNKTVNITMSKSDVGLGNVDNTSDANKPISIAMQAALDGKADASDVDGVKTVTGNPITITDGSETYAEELSVDLEPIQSGSGTPSPSNVRPIQGYDIVSVDRCGKNLFNSADIATNTVPDVTNNGRLMPQNGTDTTEHFIPLKPSTTYTISGNSRIRFWLYAQNGDYLDTYLPDAGQFTTNAQTYFIRISGNSGWQSNNIQIEENSSATTYEPYNGQTVSLQLGNKNLLPITVEGIKAANSTLTWNGNSATRNGITYTIFTNKDGCVVYIDANGTANAESTLALGNCPSDGKPYKLNGSTGGSNNTYSVRVGGYGGSGDGDFSFTPTSANNVYIQVISGQTISHKKFYPMLRDANIVDPTFSPYNPTLGGMVYGGQLTLNDDGSAVFVGDRAEYVFTGNETWSASSGNKAYYSDIAEIQNNIIKPIDNLHTCGFIASFGEEITYYDLTTGDTTTNANGLAVIHSNARFAISKYIYDNYLPLTGKQVVFPLKNPITIHLSAEQLKLLQGYNYISSNGTTIHLTYQPDNAVGDAVSKAEKYTDRLCKTGVVDTFNLYNGNTKVGSVSLLSNGFKLLYINSTDDGTSFSMYIPDKYVPKGPYQRAVVCLTDSYANPRIIEIYSNRIIVIEDKFEQGATYGTGLYY